MFIAFRMLHWSDKFCVYTIATYSCEQGSHQIKAGWDEPELSQYTGLWQMVILGRVTWSKEGATWNLHLVLISLLRKSWLVLCIAMVWADVSIFHAFYRSMKMIAEIRFKIFLEDLKRKESSLKLTECVLSCIWRARMIKGGK